ncbi:uncharacterized protein LOC118437182 [Folsomia candida]|uniref:uncharacterized protein LOC118437182 n=1 Tax=Folsomia candida TaxID=158441 RepID=UPI001604C2FF|nr:uncharacterized protein LOC118437182 [Folsomia candida]
MFKRLTLLVVFFFVKAQTKWVGWSECHPWRRVLQDSPFYTTLPVARLAGEYRDITLLPYRRSDLVAFSVAHVKINTTFGAIFPQNVIPMGYEWKGQEKCLIRSAQFKFPSISPSDTAPFRVMNVSRVHLLVNGDGEEATFFESIKSCLKT